MILFRMFDYTDCPEGPILPGQHSIERWLIEEQLRHIMMSNHEERKECAAQLLSYPLKNKIPLEYIIVEVMFGELFRLPNPLCLEIAYGSIMIELCKLQPSTMPQVLAQATELLYERIDLMNKTCFDRFVNWFSYHLSNFQVINKEKNKFNHEYIFKFILVPLELGWLGWCSEPGSWAA